jgi:hypothetical protein
MSAVAKLNLKNVERATQPDPVLARRKKLLTALGEQELVVSAMLKGEVYSEKRKRWVADEHGARTLHEKLRIVRPWFFERDNGWYVQCKYGSRTLVISGKSNAVFVNKLEEVAGVLFVLRDAANSGEFDKAIMLVTKAKA